MKYATRKLKMGKRIQFTEEQVRQLRISLEQATAPAFAQFAQARRNSWAQARNIVLD